MHCACPVCRNVHPESERPTKQTKTGAVSICPRCKCSKFNEVKDFYVVFKNESVLNAWFENNCNKCKFATDCELKQYITLNTIPTMVAKFFTYIPYNVNLKDKCTKYRALRKPKPKVQILHVQKTLF